KERGGKEQHIASILHSTEDQPQITTGFSGKRARGIQNEFMKKMAPYEKEVPGYPVQNALTMEIRTKAAKQYRPEWLSLWSGQGSRLSKRLSARELVVGIVSQVNQLVR